jgi:hypothetical protein
MYSACDAETGAGAGLAEANDAAVEVDAGVEFGWIGAGGGWNGIRGDKNESGAVA